MNMLFGQQTLILILLLTLNGNAEASFETHSIQDQTLSVKNILAIHRSVYIFVFHQEVLFGDYFFKQTFHVCHNNLKGTISIYLL